MTAPFRTRQLANCLETASPTFAEGNDNMATAAQLDLAPETGTDIAVVVAKNPGVVLVDTAKFDAFYEKLKADAAAIPVDLTTRKGRDALASFAAKVRSEKAAIDKDRLRLTKEWRDLTAQVNGAWKGIEERLNGLAVEVRAPLTAWEEREKLRVANCERLISEIKAAAVVTLDDTSESVRDRGTEVFKTLIRPEQFADLYDQAAAAREQTIETLRAALARLEKEEAERVELERLRAENEAREAREREEAEARERAQREAEEARVAEERRVAAEQEEADRVARLEQDAADKARREAEEAKQAEIDAANQRAADADAARQKVEHQREWSQKIIQHCRDAANGFIGGQPQSFSILERELETKVTATAEEFGDFAPDVERARVEALAKLREIKRQGDERRAQEAREADQAHRSAVMKAAKEAIMTCGVDEETARKVVLLIRAGEVPHVTLGF